eukprot:TRINITY_DN7348_c0_g1_i2.p1 TRINITY_DN7348_c0_g1~~TRINITY_DN7348_c0_g1_i2.p1  ORF type:complete len:295 (-),score=26.71 TRINITY_DN7348_c0_g1_i2:59-943(-)
MPEDDYEKAKAITEGGTEVDSVEITPTPVDWNTEHMLQLYRPVPEVPLDSKPDRNLEEREKNKIEAILALGYSNNALEDIEGDFEEEVPVTPAKETKPSPISTPSPSTPTTSRSMYGSSMPFGSKVGYPMGMHGMPGMGMAGFPGMMQGMMGMGGMAGMGGMGGGMNTPGYMPVQGMMGMNTPAHFSPYKPQIGNPLAMMTPRTGINHMLFKMPNTPGYTPGYTPGMNPGMTPAYTPGYGMGIGGMGGMTPGYMPATPSYGLGMNRPILTPGYAATMSSTNPALTATNVKPDAK